MSSSATTPTSKTEPAAAGMLRANVARLAGPWWVFLVTGIAWLFIAMVVLRFTTSSAVTIGLLMGVVFLIAMVNEFYIASVRSAWRWAHALMGAVFLIGSIWSFISPLNAFWTLAAATGLLLILQGALVLITSVDNRAVNSVWWLGVVAGVIEMAIGFWASQQAVPARAAFLIVYVGFLALFRGITEMVLAFELKAAQKP